MKFNKLKFLLLSVIGTLVFIIVGVVVPLSYIPSPENPDTFLIERRVENPFQIVEIRIYFENDFANLQEIRMGRSNLLFWKSDVKYTKNLAFDRKVYEQNTEEINRVLMNNIDNVANINLEEIREKNQKVEDYERLIFEKMNP